MLKRLFGSKVEHIQQLERALDGTGLRSLEARTVSGRIALRGADQAEVTVHAEMRIRAPTSEAAESFADQVELIVEREEDAARIRVEHPRPPVGTHVTVHLDISAPGGVDADLHTVSGKIQVDAIEGHIVAKTTSGSIKLVGNARGADLHTSSGSIRAEGLAGWVKARTNSGSVDVQGGTGSAVLRTRSGSVRAKIVRLEEKGEFSFRSGSMHVEIGEATVPVIATGSSGSIALQIAKGIVPVTATTGSGSVRVTLPPGFAGQLDASTKSGSVHCNVPLNDAQSSRQSVSGVIGEGGEAVVTLHAGSGSVHIGS